MKAPIVEQADLPPLIWEAAYRLIHHVHEQKINVLTIHVDNVSEDGKKLPKYEISIRPID